MKLDLNRGEKRIWLKTQSVPLLKLRYLRKCQLVPAFTILFLHCAKARQCFSIILKLTEVCCGLCCKILDAKQSHKDKR